MGTFSVWHWLVVLLVLVIIFLPSVLYIRSFQTTTRLINASGGDAPVNSAWSLLIPFLNVIWFFVLLVQTKSAIDKTHKMGVDRQWLLFGVLAGVTSVLSGTSSSLHTISGVFGLAFAVFGIMHWIKLVQLRKYFV